MDNESCFILYYIDAKCNKRIRSNDFDRMDISWKKILKIASLNRVLYLFSKKVLQNEKVKWNTQVYENLQRISDEGEQWQKRLKATIVYLNTVLSEAGVAFLVIKTKSDVPHVTFDIDILVHLSDIDRTVKAFVDSGATISGHKNIGKDTGDVCVFHPHLLKIEVHGQLTWSGLKHFDNNFVHLDPRKVAVSGIETIVPSAEAEFLLNAAHILYKHPILTIFDFLHMSSCANEVQNWDAVLHQAEKYGWSRSLAKFMRILGSIYMTIYGDSPDWVDTSELEHEMFSFPHFFSIWFVIKTLWERISVKALVNKLSLYYTFTWVRYYLFGRNRLPYYSSWYPMNQLYKGFNK